MVRLISILLSAFVVSCAVPANDGPIKIVDQRPPGAVDLGRIYATEEGVGSLVYQHTYKKALDSAMLQAEALGASHLVIDKWYREPRFWGYDQNVKGNAYRVSYR
ncbi:hypothetical protein ACFQY0_02650 [Haloferula chungangensis]|uniref:Uncharacterized protein n=1 Tax=Haloferula chungangensis TaxID=1048331 RepID=A0ABW2L443_9BACT